MTKKLLLSISGIILVFLGFYQIHTSQKGINIYRTKKDDIPVTIYTPKIKPNKVPPVVFVAHGLAGSQNIMSSFALTLSHAGFSVITWDFNGHGANSNPIALEDRSNTLLNSANTTFTNASDMGLINDANYAILGHSMGSGVALAFAQENPETKATIAVSPVGQSVSPELPRNLLLMAGSLEPNFVRNAEELLIQAGGEGGDPSQGNARKMQVIPSVEHISILFSNAAHHEARSWLEATFGQQPNSDVYTDNRLLWYLVGIIGFVVVSNNVPKFKNNQSTLSVLSARMMWKNILLLFFGTLGGTLTLWFADRIGIEIQNIFNLLVGGYVILWFGICGIIYLLIFKVKPGFPNLKVILSGLIGFSLLWLGVGLLGRYLWLEWLLIPKRLLLWPISTLLILPWFLTIGELMKESKLSGLIGWWLLNSGTVILGLYLSIWLIPGTGFLILILPMVPILLGLHMIFTVPWGRGWSFGISGAMFLSWTLIAVFPLV